MENKKDDEFVYKNIISYKKKIENKNIAINSINLCEKKSININNKIEIYRGIFNKEIIIVLENINKNKIEEHKNEIKKIIEQINKDDKNLNLYISMDNEVYTLEELNLDLKLFIKEEKPKLKNIK